MNEKKKFEEPEIVNDVEQKNSADSFFEDVLDQEFRGIKNKILLIGGLQIFIYGLIVFAIVGLFVWILYHILPFLFSLFITFAIIAVIVFASVNLYNLLKK